MIFKTTLGIPTIEYHNIGAKFFEKDLFGKLISFIISTIHEKYVIPVKMMTEKEYSDQMELEQPLDRDWLHGSCEIHIHSDTTMKQIREDIKALKTFENRKYIEALLKKLDMF